MPMPLPLFTTVMRDSRWALYMYSIGERGEWRRGRV